jgi:prolyl-tRNA editing enzyme YbaK/EbsC (Cys-tRNA(Pro) deacylase)
MMQLGTLEFLPVGERFDLVASAVVDAITTSYNEEIGVAEIDPNLSDTAAFCAHYEIPLERAANCVVLEAKRGEERYFAACVILASTRADINGVARKALDARRASFAPMDMAVSQTGMEYGAITPIGLPENWKILIDKAVADTESVIIGSGIRKSKLLLPGAILAKMPNVQVIEGLARPSAQ